MKILLSGDTHGDHDFGRLSTRKLKATGIDPAEIDYLIVLGDWGVIWGPNPDHIRGERYLKRWYDERPWETLALLGNHEGYDRIEELPWSERHDGPVRQVGEKSFILQSGNIYTIGGLRFFIFGGGASLDKQYRTPHKTWWPQEIPTAEDLQRGIQNLALEYGKVDYVLSHTCPTAMAEHLIDEESWFVAKAADPTCGMLSTLEKHISGPKPWYFGHYHIDYRWKNYQCLWNELVVIDTEAL